MSDNRHRFLDDPFYYAKVRRITTTLLDNPPDDPVLDVMETVLAGGKSTAQLRLAKIILSIPGRWLLQIDSDLVALKQKLEGLLEQESE